MDECIRTLVHRILPWVWLRGTSGIRSKKGTLALWIVVLYIVLVGTIPLTSTPQPLYKARMCMNEWIRTEHRCPQFIWLCCKFWKCLKIQDISFESSISIYIYTFRYFTETTSGSFIATYNGGRGRRWQGCWRSWTSSWLPPSRSRTSLWHLEMRWTSLRYSSSSTFHTFKAHRPLVTKFTLCVAGQF